MWLTVVLLCLTYFGADIATQFVPPPVAAHIIAWRDETALHITTELG